MLFVIQTHDTINLSIYSRNEHGAIVPIYMVLKDFIHLACICSLVYKCCRFHHHYTLDLPHPLMSPEEHNELMGGTKVR